MKASNAQQTSGSVLTISQDRFRFLGIVLILTALVIGGSLFPLSFPVMADNWAVVIGISDYEDQSIPDLRFTVADSMSFAEVLRQYCNVDADKLILLVDGQATKSSVAKAFSNLERNVQPTDMVYVFFSGHGTSVPDTDGDEQPGDNLDEALVPYDSIPGNVSSYILDDQLEYWIARLPANLTSSKPCSSFY